MKILLFSDSHGNTNNMISVINNTPDIHLIIHLGDMVRDALILQSIFPDINIECIRGNNDWTFNYPTEKILNICNKKILITHGHEYSVKMGYEKIINKGKQYNVDAIFFGHTHIYDEQIIDGMLLLNPGSIYIPLKSEHPTYCIIDINNDKIKVARRIYDWKLNQK